MSDSDEPITRQKKPLSEARLKAIEKMKEGRKRSLEVKKKQKEEEKEAKKQIKKKIKMKVEEELNGISSLPLDDKDFMEDLKQKAIEVTPKVEVAESENEVKEIIEEEIIEIKQPVKRRGIPKKKKIVVNNYYEEESSESEEEIVNNYHKKKKKKLKKKKVESSSEEEEEEYIEVVPEYIAQQQNSGGGGTLRNFNPYTNAMRGISFR
jgi:hypothetical protein